MKYIPLREFESLKTQEIIGVVLRGVGDLKDGGVSYEEMRRRIRIEDAMSAKDPCGFLLEDADFKHLVQLLKTFRFNIYTRDLLELIETIAEAKEPPAVLLPAKGVEEKLNGLDKVHKSVEQMGLHSSN